jgi:hypothetical protein
MSPLRNEVNSIIFICLTPDPPIGGEHLKIIELGSPPLGDLGGQLLFGVKSNIISKNFIGNLPTYTTGIFRVTI